MNKVYTRLLGNIMCLICLLTSLHTVSAEHRHHLVDIAIPNSMSLPDNFPLKRSPNGKKQLSCTTCHDDKKLSNWDTSTSKLPEDLDIKADSFIRGGPYEPLSNFCYRCHDKQSNQRENLHIMLDDEGKIIEKQCTYCHEKVPDRDKAASPNDPKNKPKLRLPADKLCYGCHLKTPHLNAALHQVKADEAMRKRISTYSAEQKILIPLGGEGEIRCTSCHSPHQKGVLNINSPAGKQTGDGDLIRGVKYSDHPWANVITKDKQQRLSEMASQTKTAPKLKYQRIEHEVLLRLPAKDGTLCLVCHQFDF